MADPAETTQTTQTTQLSGRMLRELRRCSGLTRAEVARRAGVPTTVISAYECGRRQPALDTAGRIIDALGFDVQSRPRLDPAVRGRRLEAVLELAEHLPYRPRPLINPGRKRQRSAGSP